MTSSNIDLHLLNEVEALAKELYDWAAARGHPEQYSAAADLEATRDFLHGLDLLETLLVRFALGARVAHISMAALGQSPSPGSIAWDFWQTDIEYYIASNLMELCYELSKAWLELQRFADTHHAYRLFARPHETPNETILALHKARHFRPGQFQDHPISSKYSILRRPYHVEDGELRKERAADTMSRVATLVNHMALHAKDYLLLFRKATQP